MGCRAVGLQDFGLWGLGLWAWVRLSGSRLLGFRVSKLGQRGLRLQPLLHGLGFRVNLRLETLRLQNQRCNIGRTGETGIDPPQGSIPVPITNEALAEASRRNDVNTADHEYQDSYCDYTASIPQRRNLPTTTECIKLKRCFGLSILVTDILPLLIIRRQTVT